MIKLCRYNRYISALEKKNVHELLLQLLFHLPYFETLLLVLLYINLQRPPFLLDDYRLGDLQVNLYSM